MNNDVEKVVRLTKETWPEWWKWIRQNQAPFQELQNNEHSDTLGHTIWAITQGCTNSECLVSVAIRRYTVASDICGSLVWNLLHITLLLPTILRRLLSFQYLCSTVVICLMF